MRQNKFRYSARKAFLTYPQCPISPKELYENLNTQFPIKYAIICQEEHEDGNKHLHAAIKWQAKLHKRAETIFDVLGYHPNIQIPKNWPATVNYVKKHGDFEEWDNSDEEEHENLKTLADSMSYTDYMQYCLDKKVPFSYAKDAWRNQNSLFTIDENYMEPEDAKVISGLNTLDLSDPIFENRSIIIIGPSGTGKSTIAKRLATKPALWCTHPDTLRAISREHKCIIFDDLSFLHTPREHQIAIVDRYDPRQIHVRYGTACIPAGIQKIFTSNNEIFLEDEAINRRIKKIYCNKL